MATTKHDWTWFRRTLRKIMVHNKYSENMFTVGECDKYNVWTPCDLVMREYYNNGGGSAKGFLGISPKLCIDMAEYIIDNQEKLKDMEWYNEKGVSNFGFVLWDNWELRK